MMTRLLTAIALVGALAAPAAAADKENLQLFRDVQKQVLGYALFTIFDNVETPDQRRCRGPARQGHDALQEQATSRSASPRSTA